MDNYLTRAAAWTSFHRMMARTYHTEWKATKWGLQVVRRRGRGEDIGRTLKHQQAEAT